MENNKENFYSQRHVMSKDSHDSHKVSVIMSVYNGEQFLRKAIESILNQTFKDFEFIIINDGSTDKTQEIVDSYKDPRIVVIKNQQNIGLPKSLNKGLEIARGEYIARMDADDISLPDRLEKQVKLLDNHRNIGYVSNNWSRLTENGQKEMCICKLPVTYEEIQKESMKWDCFCHASSMFRKVCQQEIGLYRPELELSENTDFCLRFSEKFQMANIPELLYKRHIHLKSISVEKTYEQQQFVKLTLDLARERRLYCNDRLQIPEKRQEVINYINLFKKKSATRIARAEGYLYQSRFFRIVEDRKRTFQFLIKSLILNPFNYRAWLYIGSFFTAGIRKVFNRIVISTRLQNV
jgi:glycosyltransferase involved in cell wall biosynthesis